LLEVYSGGLSQVTGGIESAIASRFENVSISMLSLESNDPPKATLTFEEKVYPAGLENYWPWGIYACVSLISSVYRNEKLTETLHLTVLSTSAAWVIWILGTSLTGSLTALGLSVGGGLLLNVVNLEQQYGVFRTIVDRLRANSGRGVR
jgi:hypothetical protein